MNKQERMNYIMSLTEQQYESWMDSLSVEEMDEALALFREIKDGLAAQMDALLDEVDETDMVESQAVLARIMAM
jgi:hypothetical protein